MCENPREFPWFECERTESKVRGTCPHCSWQNIPAPLLPCMSDIYELIFFFFFIFRQVVYGENSIEVEVKSYWRLFIEEVILLEWKCYNFFLADIFHVWLSFNWLTEWSIYIYAYFTGDEPILRVSDRQHYSLALWPVLLLCCLYSLHISHVHWNLTVWNQKSEYIKDSWKRMPLLCCKLIYLSRNFQAKLNGKNRYMYLAACTGF